MPDRPNILVIMSDQHNRGVMGCAGDPVVRTPALDRLAAQGVRFTDCYTPSPLCVPARMSFLTSRYPSEQRVRTNSCILDSNIPTFAHSLGTAGYETVLCGRMHFVGHDQRHGFEKRLVGAITAQFPGTTGMDLGPIPGSSTGQSRPAVTTAGPGRTACQAYDADVTSVAASYIRERTDYRPFAMVVGFYLPHCPYICPADLYREYYDKIALPDISEAELAAQHPFIRSWRQHRNVDDLSPDEIRSARAAYYGLVTLMDRNIGRILEALEASGRADDTLVVYTSDHGDMTGEHGLWWKSNFYEGSAGVPLILSQPSRYAGSRTVGCVTSLVDIGPTLTDIAGTGLLPGTRGTSLRGFLEGRDVPGWPDETFSEHCPARGDGPSCMVRKGPWKLNHYHGYDRPQLFNIHDDPQERHDRGADPTCAAIVHELEARIPTWWDGGQIEREYAQLMDDVKVVVDWGRAVKPACPDRWETPEGSNVFPEGEGNK